MTSAYGVFANEGLRVSPTGILAIEESDGTVLETYEKKEERALDPQIARLVSSVLSDNVARTPLYGANSPLHFPGKDIAAKTGTTNDNKDAWVIGYGTSIVAGAWAGNNIPEPMNQISGLIITPLWREFMDVALEKYPPDAFTPPAPDPEYNSLPPVLRGEWNTNPSLGVHNILYWVNKDSPRSGSPNFSDSQFSHWEYAVNAWTNGLDAGTSTAQNVNFRISSPTPGAQVPFNTPFDASVTFDPLLGIRSVTYYLNGEFVGVSAQPPYIIAVQPREGGAQNLRAVADSLLGPVENTISFTAQ